MNIDELRKLAGINGQPDLTTAPHMAAQEKRKIEQEKNIDVGSDEWFQLWFKKEVPPLEMPRGFRGRKK